VSGFFQTTGGTATIAALSAVLGGLLVGAFNAWTTRRLADLQWKRDRLLPVMADILSTSRSHMTLAKEAVQARVDYRPAQANPEPQFMPQLRVLTAQLTSAEPSVLLLGGKELAIATQEFIEVHRGVDSEVYDLFHSSAGMANFENIDAIEALLPSAEFDLVDKTRGVLRLDRYTTRKEQRWAKKQLKRSHPAAPPSDPSVPSDGP
jgi:hypothetical protein